MPLRNKIASRNKKPKIKSKIKSKKNIIINENINDAKIYRDIFMNEFEKDKNSIIEKVISDINGDKVIAQITISEENKKMLTEKDLIYYLTLEAIKKLDYENSYDFFIENRLNVKKGDNGAIILENGYTFEQMVEDCKKFCSRLEKFLEDYFVD